LWSFWYSKPNVTREATEPEQQLLEHPSPEQVTAISSRIVCPDSSHHGKSLTECQCEKAKLAEKQITALLMTGMTPASTVEHLFMMGYSAVGGMSGERELPKGHPPIEPDSD